jgi:hypothetical protein
MKLFDFKLAKEIIKQFDDLGMLKYATLGVQEDWSNCSEAIWSNGKYVKDILDNCEERQDEYQNQRYNESSHYYQTLTELFDVYDDILVAGITGSVWATPVIEVILNNRDTFVFDCSRGEYTSDVLDRVNMAITVAKYNQEEDNARSLEDVQEFKPSTSCEKES